MLLVYFAVAQGTPSPPFTDVCGLIRHTQLFILFVNTVHPEDGRKRRPKHVGVVNIQRV
jgi:hypothetical protein